MRYMSNNYGNRMSGIKFVERVKELYGDMYDYGEVDYFNMASDVKVICKLHGEFEQVAYRLLNGGGCKMCKLEERDRERKILKLEEEMSLVRECPSCGKEIRYVKKQKYKYDNKVSARCLECKSKEFINNAIKIHGDVYDYSNAEYKSSLKEVRIVCKLHGEFLQNPNKHLRSSGCPSCKESRGERKVRKFLRENGILYRYQYKFDDCINPKTNRKLYFDFYLPEENVLIEYDGMQHFKECVIGTHMYTKKELKKTRFRDRIKTEYAIRNNIMLIRIGYKDFNHIDKVLERKIYGKNEKAHNRGAEISCEKREANEVLLEK